MATLPQPPASSDSPSDKPGVTSAIPKATPKPTLKTVKKSGPSLPWFFKAEQWEAAWSAHRLSLVAILVSSLFIMATLASRYFFVESILNNQGVSTKTVVAERRLEVENIEETRQRRYEASLNVTPIYRPQAGADKLILDRLINLLETIGDLRQKSDMPNKEKANTLTQLLTTESMELPDHIESTLLYTSNWPRIYDTTLHLTESLIDKGIKSDEYINRKSIIVSKALADFKPLKDSTKAALTPEEKSAIEYLVKLKLRPTLVIDEELTNQARQLAVNSVQPVTEIYFQGDVIAQAGEKLNPVQIAALQEQGTLVENYRWFHILGVLILSAGILTMVWQFLFHFDKGRYFKPNVVAFLGTLMTATVLTFHAFNKNPIPNLGLEHIPFAILPILVTIFVHNRVALLTTTCILLLCGITYQTPTQSLGVLLIATLIGIFVLARKPVPKDRSDLILSGLAIGIAQGICILAVDFIYNPGLSITKLDIFYDPMMGMLSGLSTGIISLGILPLIESVFNMVTSYTLLELGNHDRPILKRMQFEAPGTFHHTVMVATLSEACAEAIGANPVLTRVGALYHDIGKLKRPLFFIENQAYFGVENPHDRLTPRLSKMVIAAHTRDGVEMGRQLKLPETLLDFMTEHHGTTIIGYFYNKAVLQEGEENVKIDQFRYAGPKPQTKETAICMLCDASESSVRALKNPTVQQLEERVEKIFKQRIDDAQFSECPITLQEISIIKQTIVRMLRAIQHQRIEYQQNVLQELGKASSGQVTGHVMETHQKLNKTLSTIKEHPPLSPKVRDINASASISPANPTPSVEPLPLVSLEPSETNTATGSPPSSQEQVG